MITQLHVAKTTLYVFERKLAVITDNISNGQTVGFKERRMELETMFPLAFERAVTEYDDSGPTGKKRRKQMEYGMGVNIAGVTKNFNPGTIEITNQNLDFAVVGGPGMLQFRLPDGSYAYSRAGNLHQDFEGNVVNVHGHPVEPPLRIPKYTSQIMVNEEGRVFVQLSGESEPREVGQMMLTYFQNPAGLRETGQNLSVETAASGEASLETPGRNGVGNIQQGALEFSNVNIIEQMLQMVMVQRIFDVAIKAVNATDSILKKGGNIGA
jgi:flagellar basal-body rod protein FlgG